MSSYSKLFDGILNLQPPKFLPVILHISSNIARPCTPQKAMELHIKATGHELNFNVKHGTVIFLNSMSEILVIGIDSELEE